MTEAGPRVAVVDHGTGNLTSIVRALQLGGATVVRTSDHRALFAADAVVLPGVGAFPRAMESLRDLGLVESLRSVAASGRPLFGVCLGLQLLFDGSEEMGGSEGLGILPGKVRALDAQGERLPHIGWSAVEWKREHPLVRGLANPCPMYHVHSYVAAPDRPDDILATAVHGERFTTAVANGNVLAVQFHPEKSSADGLRLISNFVAQLREEAFR